MRDSDAQNRPPMCAVSASQSSECASALSASVDAFDGGAWNDAQSSAPIGFVPTGARPHLLSSQRPCVNDSSASATRVARAICAIALGKLSKCREARGALCLKCATNTALPSGRGRTSASSSNVSAPARDPSATPARDATNAAKNATRGIERRALGPSDDIAHPVTPGARESGAPRSVAPREIEAENTSRARVWTCVGKGAFRRAWCSCCSLMNYVGGDSPRVLLKNSHPGLPLALSTGLSLPLSAGLPLALSPSNAGEPASSSEPRGDKTPSKLRRCLGGGVGGGS